MRAGRHAHGQPEGAGGPRQERTRDGTARQRGQDRAERPRLRHQASERFRLLPAVAKRCLMTSGSSVRPADPDRGVRLVHLDRAHHASGQRAGGRGVASAKRGSGDRLHVHLGRPVPSAGAGPGAMTQAAPRVVSVGRWVWSVVRPYRSQRVGLRGHGCCRGASPSCGEWLGQRRRNTEEGREFAH